MTVDNSLARLSKVPLFTLASATVADGADWPAAQFSGFFGVPGRQDRSPHLAWVGSAGGDA